MSDKKELSELKEKINDITIKLDKFFQGNISAQKTLNRDLFAKFYNATKYDFPVHYGLVPLIIWINKSYEEDMVKNLLYPAEEENLYYLVGEFSPIAIGFKETYDNSDFYVDFRLNGNFK